MSISNTDFVRSDESLFEAVSKPSSYYGGIFDIVGGINGAYICGGFMTNDIDIFFTDSKAKDSVRFNLQKLGWIKSPKSVYMCENWLHKDFTWEVQLVLGAIYNDPFHIIDGFDLRCCMMAYDGFTLWRHKETYSDLEKRLINIHRIRDPAKVQEHVLRYMKKGFNISAEGLKTIFEAIAQNPSEKTTKPGPVIIEHVSNIGQFSIKELSRRTLKGF